MPGETSSPSSASHGKRNGNVAGIVAGVIGGVAAIFAVISITAFVRRRRRRSRPRSIYSDFRVAGPELIVTPFDPYNYEAAQDSGLSGEQQPLVTGGPGVEMVALHRLSATPPTPDLLPQPETRIPVGLSDKEIARLRAEGFNSRESRNLGVSSLNVFQSTSSLDTPIPLPQPETPIPVGLSDKEIAQLRAANSQQAPNFRVSSSNVFQSTSSLDAPIPLPQPETPVPVGLSDKEIARLRVANSQQAPNFGVSPSESSSDVLLQPTSSSEPREAPIDPRRLHSEVEYRVRQEMDRLRAQGLVIEAPPSYSEGGE